jgi:hypothetical protein
MSKINYIITDHNITVNYQGQTHIVSRQEPLANQLIEAIKQGKSDQIPDLVSTAKRVETFGQGDFTVRDGIVSIRGREVPEVLSKKILRFADQGLPHQPLVRFADNLLENPSFRAVQQLFQFLEHNDHPLTEDGNFIAYKKVRADFKDAYTGTFDNSPGQIPEVPRNQVDEDPTKTCSNGLHVANWNYAHDIYHAGDNPIMLEVEVNPKDVVAVPDDYDQSKMRLCRYKVLGVVDCQHSEGTALRTAPPQKKMDPCPECCERDCSGECQDECPGEVDPEEYCDNCDELLENCLCQECEDCGSSICYGDCQGDFQEETDEYPWEDEVE